MARLMATAAAALLLALPASASAASPVQGSVFGPIVSVKGTTFTLTTSLSPSGRSTVSTGSASITEQATAGRSSLKVGTCVMATGTRSSSGVVAASRLTITTCGTPRFRGNGLRRGTGQRPPGGVTPRGNFGFAVGSITKLSGSTLTVKGAFGGTSRTTTVSLSSQTAILHTVEVGVSAIKLKMCAFVRGTSADKGITVKAANIALSAETNGTCTNGFRRPGS